MTQRPASTLGSLLFATLRGGSVGCLARVIEHLWDVEDFAFVPDLCNAAKQQIVVVAAVEPRPEPAGSLHERSLEKCKVGDVVLRVEQVLREVRLEVRLTALA